MSIPLIITNWVGKEPFGSLWLVVVMVLLFGVTIIQAQTERISAGAWFRAVIEALVKSLSFALLVGMIYFLLSSNATAFENVYGSFVKQGTLSNTAHEKWVNIYGNSFFQQQDLEVTQYTLADSVEPLPENPTLYKTIQTEQVLAENSISRFRGKVYLQGADWKDRDATFNAYVMKASYEYDVINNLTERTETHFYFPLFGGSKLYQGISVKIDGVPVVWQYKNSGLAWENPLDPDETVTVLVEYQTWSMDGYSFVVQKPRDVRDFNLLIAIDYGFC